MADQNEELKEFTLGKFNNGDPNLLAPNTYIEKDGEMIPAAGVGLPEGTTLETEESKLTKQPTVQVSGTQTTTPVVTETPETKPAYSPSDYLVDWGKMTPKQAYDLRQHSINDLMYDQQKWAKATGNDFNWFPWAGLSKDQDINKTQAENEEDERKAKAKARWDSIGRFVRELGNFVGVAGFGGMNIPSKDASPEEYTARQKQLRDATIAMRNAYNKNLFADLTKQMADERNAETAKLNKALTQARIDEIGKESKRKDEKNKADIARIGAQQQQSTTAAKVNEERANQIRLTPVKTTGATGRGRKSSSGRRQGSAVDLDSKWAENKRKYPKDAEQFLKNNRAKIWTKDLRAQFNAIIADREKSGTGRTKIEY